MKPILLFKCANGIIAVPCETAAPSLSEEALKDLRVFAEVGFGYSSSDLARFLKDHFEPPKDVS